jgi:hypothetical protein
VAIPDRGEPLPFSTNNSSVDPLGQAFTALNRLTPVIITALTLAIENPCALCKLASAFWRRKLAGSSLTRYCVPEIFEWTLRVSTGHHCRSAKLLPVLHVCRGNELLRQTEKVPSTN